MLSKLALRNVKRSMKDYMVYLITVTLAFSLIFSFQLIIFSDDILALSKVMKMIQSSIITISAIVVFVIGWLIYYTMRFMFQKRSKEFGTYMLLGIEKGKIVKMFLLENLILGFISLLFSFLLGSIISQVMTLIIMNVFELPYQVHFSFSLLPFLLTILYFGVIYLFVLWKARKQVRKMKLYDLLYLDKRNEKKYNQSHGKRLFIFTTSLILGIVAFIIFHRSMEAMIQNGEQGTFQLILLSVFFMIISIYGMTLTFSDFLITIILKNKNFIYHKDHLFVIRQFTTKIRTMGFTLGTLSLLITLTFILLNLSNIFYDMFVSQTESAAPYDIIIHSLQYRDDIDPEKNYTIDEYLSFIEDYYQIKERITYHTYCYDNSPIRPAISNGLLGYEMFDHYMKVSDYNQLLFMRGMKEITLQQGEYYIHSFRDVSKELHRYVMENEKLQLGGISLVNKGIRDDHYSTAWAKGASYIVIVPDEVVGEHFDVASETTAINTVTPTTEKFGTLLSEKFPPHVFTEEQEDGYEIRYIFQHATVKGEILGENRGTMTILAFSLMYLAFIFVAVVGTILSIQSLSDSTKYCYRYRTLKKLGMNQGEINRTLKKQLLVFFLFPIVYPVIISCVTSLTLNMMFRPFMQSDYSILGFVFVNLLLFLLIYFIYFLATYIGFKKNINE